jgi:tetratricopeptide (TPR) repeat protein
MRSTMRTKSFTRRDILFGLKNRFKQTESPLRTAEIDGTARDVNELIRKERYAEAVDMLRNTLRKSPDHFQAGQKLGYCLMKLGELDRASEVFDQLLDIRPGDNFSHLYLGLVRARQGDPESALQHWKQYFNVDQPIIQRALNLQAALFQSGAPSTAADMAEHVEQAIEEQHSSDEFWTW